MDDLKVSLRQLRKTPGFTVAAIVVLALGIGLNAAMFTVVHALAFAARPFPEPERLVQLYSRDGRPTGGYRAFSYALYEDLSARTDLFDGVLAHYLTLVGVGEGAGTRRTLAGIVSASYFDVLGVGTLHGRGFTAEEGRPGRDVPVAVVTHAYWERTGSNPQLVGQTIRINGRPFTVIGITPRGFTGTISVFGPDVFLPLGVSDAVASVRPGETPRRLSAPDVFRLTVIGRLKQDASAVTANEALRLHGQSLSQSLPDFQHYELSASPLPRFGVGTSPQSDAVISTLGATLLGMTGAVLLTVCLNLASMLLARGRARRQEIAVRLALGARRSRVIRQLLTEGLLLSLTGGALGVVLGRLGIERVLTTISAILPITLVFDSGATVALIVATAVCCLVATLSFALGPALKHSKTDIVSDLKAQSGDDPAPRRWAIVPRNPLVAAQIALSLSLLIAAGLFMRMALGGALTDLGYRADDTVIAEVDSRLGGLDEARSLDLYARLEERLMRIPGVQTASIGALVPLGLTQISRPVQRAGAWSPSDSEPSTPEEGRRYFAPWNSVSAGYFNAMGIRVLQGRPFTPAETFGRGAPSVAILDDTLARRLWPAGDALGQLVQWADRDGASTGDRPSPMEVVGIVSATQRELFENIPRGAIYVPFAQGVTSNVHFYVRPTIATSTLVDDVRLAVHDTAPGLPLFTVRTFRAHVAASPEYWALTMSSAMFAGFGGLAMAIALVGIYGVTAYMVTRRRREIGVRIAVGARPSAVMGLILRDSMGTTLAGIVVGWLLGLGVGQVMDSMFVDVAAFDVWTFSLVPVGFVLAASAATWLPARRATAVSPMATLRSE